METSWSKVAVFLAALCAIAFVLTTTAAVLLVNADLVLFNTTTYKNTLVQQQAYNQMPHILAEQVLALANNSKGELAFFQSLTVSDMETLISGLLPPEELRTLTENLLEQVIAYANGDQENISISLISLKQQIAGPDGTNAVLQLIRSKPDCSIQDLTAIMIELQSGEVTLLLCRPPEEALTLFSPAIQTLLTTASAQIPDDLVLYPQAGTRPAGTGLLGMGPSGWIRLAGPAMRLSPCLPLFFLIVVTLLAVRKVKSWLRWWGIPIFFSGLLSLGVALSAPAFFDQTWNAALLANHISTYLTPELISLSRNFAYAVLQTLTKGIITCGIVLAVLGLLMWIVSGLIKNGNEVAGRKI